MTNKEVIGILNEIALLLDLSGENPFKGRAYTNVARQIEQLEGPLADIVHEKRLRSIKGVGNALEQKIEELVTTGALVYHQDLRSKFPDTLFDLFTIPGLGPKRIKALYEEAKVHSVEALEEACTSGALGALKGFGPKMVERIQKGIAFARQHQGLFHFDKARAEGLRLLESLSNVEDLQRIEIAGSLRRRKEVIKDIDIVASSTNPASLMKRFTSGELVDSVTGQGETKASAILESGLRADLRVVSEAQYPFALAYFTGSKEHNVVMRQRAKERGLKLNEYGLFKAEEPIACKEEAAIFAALDLPYIPPELREDRGEFRAESMPALVQEDQFLGVFHCHSSYSDGQNTIAQMAAAAKSRGYHYLTMTDHSQSAAYAGGLRPSEVRAQQEEIDALNKTLQGFKVLKGIESDIRTDGTLDYEDGLLAQFELIIASVHNKLDMAQDEATKRVIKAVENPYTTILGHPTGRLLLSRQGFPLDFDKVFDACAANRVAIEINGNCRRLDMDWRHVRRARDKGVMLCIGPDAHSIEGLDQIQYGVGIARKGWLEAPDLLNSMSLSQFMDWKKA